MINQEIETFCEKWIEKADGYDKNELQGAFDNFFTLFVVYNRLYVEATFRMSNRNEINILTKSSFPDSKAAKSYVIKYLTSRKINEALKNDNSCVNAINQIRNIIQNRDFNINLHMVTGMPDRDKDIELLNKLNSNNTNSKILALTDIIYSIRCNVFHGQKRYEDNQLIMLRPVSILLKKIIDLLFEKLKNE